MALPNAAMATARNAQKNDDRIQSNDISDRLFSAAYFKASCSFLSFTSLLFALGIGAPY
jgi:hypothetical protein